MGRPTKKEASKSKINFNFKPIVKDLVRTGITQYQLHGMTWGVAFLQNEMKPYRCVRWRRYGMVVGYILIGRDRGRVLPVMRNFKKIRECTKEDEIKIWKWKLRYEKWL